jgi:hypothetical protein
MAFTEFSKPPASGLSTLGALVTFRGSTAVTLPAANAIKMSDLYGLSPHAATVTIAVVPPNVTATPTVTAAWTQTLTASITPALATTTWNWTQAGTWPAWAALTSVTNVGTVTVADPKQIPVGATSLMVRVEAVHGGVSDDEFIGITLNRAAPSVSLTPPSVTATPPIGTPYTQTFTPAGADTYAWTGAPGGVFTIDPNALPVGTTAFSVAVVGTVGVATGHADANLMLTRAAPTAVITTPDGAGVTWAIPAYKEQTTTATTAAKASVAASGGAAYTYAWTVEPAGGPTPATPTAADTALTLPTTIEPGAHTYTLKCVVTSGAASVTVQVPVTLTVQPTWRVTVDTWRASSSSSPFTSNYYGYSTLYIHGAWTGETVAGAVVKEIFERSTPRLGGVDEELRVVLAGSHPQNSFTSVTIEGITLQTSAAAFIALVDSTWVWTGLPTAFLAPEIGKAVKVTFA